MAKISILGSGGWGTAIAVMLAKENHDVILWSYKEEEKNERSARNSICSTDDIV